MLVFVFSILFTQAASGHIHDFYMLENGEVAKDTTDLRTHWGTVPRGMLSLYMAITGGISWYEILVPLYPVGPHWVCLLVMYVCFAQFAVLNVLTGVFCQNAIESAQKDEDLAIQEVLANKRYHVRQMQELFKSIDTDCDGSISMAEFHELLHDETLRAHFETMGVDPSDVDALFRLMDTDGGSVIEIDEFIDGILRMRGLAQRVDLAKMSYEHRFMFRELNSAMQKMQDPLAAFLENTAVGDADAGGADPNAEPKDSGTRA